MNVTLKLPDGELRRLVRQATAWEAGRRKEVQKLIILTALAIEREAKRLVSQAGSGRTYTRGGVTHQASAPGAPPASDTGRLESTIRSDLSDIASLVARVAAGGIKDVDYAAYLELGTSRMAARPYLRPAYNKHIPAFIAGLKKIYSKA